MHFSKTLLAFTLVLFSVTASQAQTQRARIRHGVKSGELTRRETKTLVKQQVETRQDVKAAKADGVVTAAEKKEIKQDKRKSNRAIYRKKHNVRVRG